MTKEQVIELIKEYKVAKVEFPNDLQEQGLDMAIEALEQQPSEDCVSRQALINSYNGIETPVGYRKVVDM